jgi:hypothetical protein
MEMKIIYLSLKTGWKTLSNLKNEMCNNPNYDSRELHNHQLKVCILFSLKNLYFLYFFKDNETPKVVTSIVARPTITQTSMINKQEIFNLSFCILAEEAMPCVLCLTTERQVACLPCGHLTSCVACGHSLKTCPICRANIKAFVRIYVWINEAVLLWTQIIIYLLSKGKFNHYEIRNTGMQWLKLSKSKFV